MAHQRSSYSKPYRSIEQQVGLLRSRGLDTGPDSFAETILHRIGYYRLSGYLYPFRAVREKVNPEEPPQRLSTFQDGTTLVAAVQIYDFDKGLRLLLFEAIETFEVALRFQLGYLLGEKGPFSQHEPASFESTFLDKQTEKYVLPGGSTLTYASSRYEEWLKGVRVQQKRSQEAFAQHFRSKYGDDFPIWAVTEVLSFGSLISLFEGMRQHDREQVATQFEIFNPVPAPDAQVLSSWLNHLRYVRNLCAHHSRVWNRNFDVSLPHSPALEELGHLTDLSRRRVYGTCAVIAYLLARIDPANDWSARVLSFICDSASRLGLSLEELGFPPGWDSERIWSREYRRDEQRAARIALLNDVETVSMAGAVSRLTAFPLNERRSKINYWRKNHILLAPSLTPQHQYPIFQFDLTSGDVPDVVVRANRRLFVRLRDLSWDEQQWSSLDWWMTPQEGVDGKTPLELHSVGGLTLNVLDEILKGPED